jgi:apolipoprotein N-acyltransferase
MLKILQHNLALSLFSGALLTISFPFSGSITPLVFVAWIPLFVVALRLKQQARGLLNFLAYAYFTAFIFKLQNG